ncbi:MAG: amidohydrolase [Bacteroidetes bacterium]|nr:MAG: amidohydrolase [Bacteroidota bacterium]
MKKIDAHHHCWRYNAQKHAWIDDSMRAIQRSFVPSDLQPALDANGVVGTVLVQVDQESEENQFMLALAAASPFIKGIVGWVDLQADDLAEQLEKLTSATIVKGFRHIAQAEADDFLAQKEIIAGIGTLQRYGFTYDILIKPPQMKAALKLVQALPNQPFVIDHLAKPYIAAGALKTWAQDMRALAQADNVYCKISGLVTEANWTSWTNEQLWPYMDVVLEAFGPQRLMFGTDWPVCLVAASYNAVVASVGLWVEKLSAAEQQDIWYNTAAKFYNLR